MSKTVYYTHPLDHGCYFDAMIVPDDFDVTYPITAIPIPEELQDEGIVAKFRFETQLWEDASTSANEAKDLKRDQDLTAAQQKIAAQQETIDGQAATITDLQSQLAEAQDAIVELAQATLPSTDDTTATATETEAK